MVDIYAKYDLHRINEDDVRKAYEDGEGRQAYSLQAMLDAHLWLEWYHHEAKAKGTTGKKAFGQYFVIGPKGSGKTVAVNYFTTRLYGAGYDVFSVSSLLYGYRLKPAQVYAFAKIAQPGIVVYIDETHEWAHALGGQRRAQQVFENSTAELRKLECNLFLSTVLDNRVSGVLKHETLTVLVPQKYVPASAKASTRPGGVRPKFPPWCYIKLGKVGPYPWQMPGIAEEMGLVPVTKTRKKKAYMSPRLVYTYTKCMNSFERGRLGEGRSVEYGDVEDILLSSGMQEPDDGAIAAFADALRAVLDYWLEQGRATQPLSAKDFEQLFYQHQLGSYNARDIGGFMHRLGVLKTQQGQYQPQDILARFNDA